MNNNRPTGGILLHNIERARFLPPIKNHHCCFLVEGAKFAQKLKRSFFSLPEKSKTKNCFVCVVPFLEFCAMKANANKNWHSQHLIILEVFVRPYANVLP